MANLKEIKNRIYSVKSTQQITSAMKLVSAAKLKRAQDAIIQMRPYAEKLNEIIQSISTDLNINSPYVEQRTVNKILYIPVSSNRGLCGAFNAVVIKKINLLIKENNSKEQFVLPIGKKANDAFKKTKYYFSIDELNPNELFHIFDDLTFDNTCKIASKIMHLYTIKEFDKIVLIYNRFKNAAVQILTVEQFLPVEAKYKDSNTNVDYIFEPSKEIIITQLIPKLLKVQLFKALLDSNAAEHGARMTAMHKATDNATELLKDLKLTYNKERQAAITKEILEIVSGAEALNA